MRMYQPKYSFSNMDGEARLREMILYVAQRCAPDPTFGATKLNKILHHSDLECFARHGVPLTGVEYQALPQGPAPRRLLPIKRRMLEDRDIDEDERPALGGHRQVRVIALRAPNLSSFTEQQLAVVNGVIGSLWGQSAISASVESHGRAWRIARKADDLIPYEAAFLSEDEPVRSDDAARARELARQYGWGRP